MRILRSDRELIIRPHALPHPRHVIVNEVGNERVAVALSHIGTLGLALSPAVFVRSARHIPERESLARFSVVGAVEQAVDSADVGLQSIEFRCNGKARTDKKS